jgi:hypothetical protein
MALVQLGGAARTTISKLRYGHAFFTCQFPSPGSGCEVMRVVGKSETSSPFLGKYSMKLPTSSQNLTQTDDDHWPEQTVSIIGPRGRICDRVARELRYCCTASDLISYWREGFHWSESQVALVDLLGTQKAIAKMSSDAKQRVQKLRCG